VNDSNLPLLMGLDLGSSAIKGVVIDATGATLCSTQKSVTLSYPREWWVELDAEQHYREVCQVIRELSGRLTRPVEAVAMSAASGNSLLTDGAGDPLTTIISWMDLRGWQQLPRGLSSFEADEVGQITGWPFSGSFPLVHFAWFRESLPDLYASAAHCCMNTDWLLFRLTGNWVMDHSTATTTCLQNQVAREYHAPYLELLGIPEEKPSRLAPSGTLAGTITEAAAEQTGLPVGTSVCTGSFDHPSAARAVGVLDPGQLLLSCGTSWVGLFAERDRQTVIDAGILCDPFLSDRGGPWGAMTSVPLIGPSIDWYVSNIIAPDSDDPFTVFNESAARVEPGSGGLQIDLRDPPGPVDAERDNVSRAVMEGAARLLNDRLNQLAERGITFNRAVMVGGPAKSPIWPGIVAETTGIPITVGSNHAGARGAALLAGIGAEVYRDEADAFAATGGNL